MKGIFVYSSMLTVLLSVFGAKLNAQERRYPTEISVSAGISQVSDDDMPISEATPNWYNKACDIVISRKQFISSSVFYTTNLNYNFAPTKYIDIDEGIGTRLVTTQRRDYEVSAGLGYSYKFGKANIYLEGNVGFAYKDSKYSPSGMKIDNSTPLDKLYRAFQYNFTRATNTFGLQLGLDYTLAKHWKVGLVAKERYFNQIYYYHSLNFKLSYVL